MRDFFIIDYFLSAPKVDYFFYLLMLAAAILSKVHSEKRELYVNSIATLGMVGTFLGICTGLQNFDASNITESVPALLSGMKTAFYTSFFGTGITIVLKVFYAKYGKKQDPIEKEFFDNNEIVRKQNETIIALLKRDIEIKNSFNDKVLRALINQGEVQKNFISEFNKKEEITKELYTSMLDEFKTFKEKMAKENNEAFTEALGACIKTLNKDMMEQLGENFNKFNEGMMRLVNWQDKYIEIIKETEDKQQKIVNTFTLIENRLSRAADAISTLSEHSTAIYNICEEINSVVKHLSVHSQSAAESEEKLKETMVRITDLNEGLEIFVETISGILTSLEVGNKLLNENYSNNTKYISQLNSDLNRFSSEIKELHEKYNISMRNELETSVKSIQELNKNIRNEYVKIITNTATGMELVNKKVGEQLQKHVDNIEIELGKTLNASLMSLGEELAALSKKFVDDYTPLTNKLRDIIKIAEKVK